jgi:hypothetical protein
LEQSESGLVVVRVDSAKSSDAGQYLCYGYPADRSTYTTKAITVIVEGATSQGSGDADYKYKIDENAEMSCALTDESTGSPDLQWKKIDGVLMILILIHFDFDNLF